MPPLLPPPASPEKVGPEFVLEVEVYCSVPADDPPSSKPSTPIKMLRKFSKSKVNIHIAHSSNKRKYTRSSFLQTKGN